MDKKQPANHIPLRCVPGSEYLASISVNVLGMAIALMLFNNNALILNVCAFSITVDFFLISEYLIKKGRISQFVLARRLGIFFFPLELLASGIILHTLLPHMLFPVQAIWALMFMFYNSFRIKSQTSTVIISIMTLFALAYSVLFSDRAAHKLVFSFISMGIMLVAEVQRRIMRDIASETVSKVKKVTDNLVTEIESTQREIVFKFSEIAESRSRETGNHVRRVAEYSRILAMACGFEEKTSELLRDVSPMHDIGKLGVPESILAKPGKLTCDEREFMKRHTVIGYDMLKNSQREVFNAAAIVAHEHHEKYDGSGYPLGKGGNNIHLYGRITAIADVFDALASDRCYKHAWSLEKVLELFKEEKGRHFDPVVVDIFFNNLDILVKIKEKFSDS